MRIFTKRPGISVFRALCYTTVVLCLICATSFAQEKASPEFDIPQAKLQWQKAKTMAAGSISGTIQAKSTYIRKPSPDAGDPDSTHQEVKQNANCCSVCFFHDYFSADKKGDFLLAVNQKYAFQIRRIEGSQDWSFENIDLASDGSQLPRTFSQMPLSEVAQYMVCEHFYVMDHKLSLEILVDKPFFRVTQTKSVKINDSSFVQVDFESLYPLAKRKDHKDPLWHHVQRGYLVFDPNNYWCLKAYRVEAEYSDSWTIFSRDFTYSRLPTGFPLLQSSKLTQQSKRRDGTEWFTLETNGTYDFRQSANEFEDRAFTLSAYNLPEPPGISWNRPTPRYVWFLLAAGGAIALAFGFRSLSRRAKKRE